MGNYAILIDSIFHIYISYFFRFQNRCRRERWKNPGRTDIWWHKLSSEELLQEEWCKNLRIDVNSFMEIADELRPVIAPHADSFRYDTVSAEKKVAMTLYYIKDQGSYRMTANTFGISPSTLSVLLRQVCKSINEIMGPKLINFPYTHGLLKYTDFQLLACAKKA